VAEEAGRVVGAICGELLGPDEAEIWWLHIAGEARGQGIGRALWAALVAPFPAPRPRWETSVIVGNPALAFYRRLGFRVTRDGTWAAYGHEVALTYLELAPGEAWP
jgi:ribosomal protein S18 acetylase RimI-like enzyme